MDFQNKDRVRPAVLKRLSPRACAAYAQADPLEIYQRGELFYLRGMLDADELTFEEMDKFFSDIADALGY